jgi:Phage integrase, N-terminal SAM-like domain
MTALAPTVESFFTGYLIGQRGASPHTITSYRDTLRLLFEYVYERTGIRPSALDVADLGAEMVSDFLAALEQTRHNTAQTRNLRHPPGDLPRPAAVPVLQRRVHPRLALQQRDGQHQRSRCAHPVGRIQHDPAVALEPRRSEAPRAPLDSVDRGSRA